MSPEFTQFLTGDGGVFTLAVVLILFALGALVFIFRRNLLHVLMGVELMLNAVNLSLIYFSTLHQNYAGQIFSLMIFVVAAAEVAVGIAIIMLLFKRTGTLGVDAYVEQKR